MASGTRSDPQTVPSNNIKTLARCAQVVSAIGLTLFAGVTVLAVLSVFFDGASLDAQLREEFLKPGSIATFTTAERALGVVLLTAPAIPGVIALLSSCKLFAGYRRGEIFTRTAAARLRLIGWMVVFLSPATQAAQTIGTSVFSLFEDPSRGVLEISFTDTDVYAIVFGLLIVVVGHIMYEAANLSDENRSFV